MWSLSVGNGKNEENEKNSFKGYNLTLFYSLTVGNISTVNDCR